MKRSFQDNDYTDADFICENCNWKGKGEEAHVIDYYGISKEKELHCPSCDGIIGTIRNNDANGIIDLSPE